MLGFDEVLLENEDGRNQDASGSTVLCLDYALHGIGSNSCGPKVLEKYRFDDTRFRFRFSLVPFLKSTDQK